MSKVSEINKPEPPKHDTMIVCTTDGKPLSAEDQKQLDEYIAYRKARYLKSKKAKS